MNSFIYRIILFLFLFAFLWGCAPEKQLNQPEVKAPPNTVDTRPEWQIEWDRVITESKREGRVTMYGAYGLAIARDIFIETIKNRFGLELEMTVARGPELSAKLIAERRAGLYLADVYMGGATDIVASLLPGKILDPIEPSIILPEIKDPALWMGGKLPIWDKERRVFSSLAQMGTRTVINTSYIKPEEITSYLDVIKPKWKNKIIMSDPTTSGSGHSWASLAVQLMGTDYLKELVKQEPFLTRDVRLLNEWLTRGKYIIGLGTSTNTTMNFIKEGAPLFIVPTFREGVEIRGAAGHVGMINRPPHPNAAKVFLNWILSKDGQTVLARANIVASRRIDVPTDHLDPWQVPDPKANYIYGETEDALLEESKMLELFKKLFDPLIKS